MKCPKCRYSSFPHLENCPKCGFGLAEQRAAFGVYALPPDPLDLLLAYQAATMDATAETLTPRVSGTSIDLGELEGIDLEIAEVEPDVAGAHESEVPANADPDLMSTLGHQVLEEGESAAVRQVYDLDLDEDLDGLGLGSTVDEMRADDEEDTDDEAVEYTLEIEEDVEFEIEESELEQDDEDDDDR